MTSLEQSLTETLTKVRDERLDLRSIEELRDKLIAIKTSLHLRIADLKKKRALYLVSAEGSVAARKMAFDATEDGQSLLSYVGMIAGLSGEIESLRGRIFSLIR